MLDLEFFYLLKKELLLKYQESYPQWKRTIHDFKGKEISNFQQLLQDKVHSRISEKWFYTHIKPTTNEKLPRLDMLDLLCQFLGYSDWDDFKNKKQTTEPTSPTINASPIIPSIFSWKKFGLITSCFIGLVLLWSAFLRQMSDVHTFCFVDKDTKEKIADHEIEIEIFNDNESPILQKSDKNGCFEIDVEVKKITFAVKTPYYYSDTITRVLQNKNHFETIQLKKDDYALMIHLFSNEKIKDWEKQRQQLSEIIADNAVIFQVEKNNTLMGLDMLNKEEFIDRMTLPINSLKNIKIIQTLYQGDQIYRLRFILDD